MEPRGAPDEARSRPRGRRGRVPRVVRRRRRRGRARHLQRTRHARRRERRDARRQRADGATDARRSTTAGMSRPAWDKGPSGGGPLSDVGAARRRPPDYHGSVLEALTRRRLLRAALGGLTALGVLPEAGLARRNLTPRLSALAVQGAARRFTRRSAAVRHDRARGRGPRRRAGAVPTRSEGRACASTRCGRGSGAAPSTGAAR